MEARSFLRWYRTLLYRRNAYRLRLLVIAERVAKERAQLAPTN